MNPQRASASVFLSYARSDGEAFARRLRERLEAEGIALWRDREGMEGGRDWWQQITAAIDAVEFLVLVMTEAALASPMVRREWRYARQRCLATLHVDGSLSACTFAQGGKAAVAVGDMGVYFLDLAGFASGAARVNVKV